MKIVVVSGSSRVTADLETSRPTITEWREFAGTQLNRNQDETWQARLNGVLVPPENEQKVIPAEGDTLVFAPNVGPLLYKDSRVRIGGLMRCCDGTITKFVQEHGDEEVEEGKVIDCMYEGKDNKRIIFRNGAFEWNRTDNLRDWPLHGS